MGELIARSLGLPTRPRVLIAGFEPSEKDFLHVKLSVDCDLSVPQECSAAIALLRASQVDLVLAPDETREPGAGRLVADIGRACSEEGVPVLLLGSTSPVGVSSSSVEAGRSGTGLPRNKQIDVMAAVFRALYAKEWRQRRIASNVQGSAQDSVSIDRQQLRDLLQRVRASEEAKRLLLSNMRHEFMTPLTAIIGMADVIALRKPEGINGAHVAAIRTAAKQLEGLLQNLLELAEVATSAGRFCAQNFITRQLLGNVVALYMAKAAKNGQTIELKCAPEVPNSLFGDESGLKSVLTKLLDNAVKFSESGAIRVRASLERSFADIVNVRFEVEDDGIGIECQHQERIFEAFEQVDGSLARPYGGAGIGLAICAHLVHSMRGKIGVRSQIGVGSTFWFTARFSIIAPSFASDLLACA